MQAYMMVAARSLRPDLRCDHPPAQFALKLVLLSPR
jgi:hypothetical protein